MHASRLTAIVLASFVCLALNTRAAVAGPAAPGSMGVHLDLDAWRTAAAGQPFTIEGFPLPSHAPVDLALERFSVLAPGATVTVAREGGRREPINFDPDSFLLLRGTVAGLAGSHVYLSAAPQGPIAGIIALGPGRPAFHVASPDGARDRGPGEAIVFPARPVFRGAATVPMCAPSLGAAPISTPARADPQPIRGLRQAELAVDADYEFFTLFNDEHLALAYLVQLYGAVNSIYVREARVRLDLVYVNIWTTPDDPYGDGTRFPAIPGGVQFDLAQMLSGLRNTNPAGQGQIGGRFSWSAYTNGFFASPDEPSVFNQDVELPAHELGHCLGAPHTDAIGIDTCHNGLTQPRRGSLMSYCSQSFSGGPALCDFYLHTLIRERIEQSLAGRPGFVFDCNGNGVDDAADLAGGASPDLNANGVPDECEDCNANGTLDSDDIAGGASLDLNANGIPDECEPDCNANGVPDDLDIQRGDSLDEHGNGVPDECEADLNANGRSDYNEIQQDMALDINRDAILDAYQDCDGDGTPDLEALDGAHSVWVASGLGVIRQYHPLTGVLMRTAGEGLLNDPQGLVITPDRRVQVASAGDHRIVEFDHRGQYIRDLVASGAGGLDWPAGLLLADDGALIVASRNTSSVLRYDATTGAFLGVLVAAETAGLFLPHGLAFGLGGELLVTSETGEVLEFDAATGAYLRRLVPRQHNGGLQAPRGLLLVPHPDRLLVASAATHQVLAYDAATGAPLGQFNYGDYRGLMRAPWDLARSPGGDVYVSILDTPGPRGQPVHQTDARIFQFDGRTGVLRRGYVQGHDSMAIHLTGLAVVPGDAVDCNRNARPDSCDIASGCSADHDADGVPDECQRCIADCNGDGRLDVADFVCFRDAFLVGDRAADCDLDGVLAADDFQCFREAFIGSCRPGARRRIPPSS